MSPVSYTSRGFADYLAITDRYGSTVTVRQSSLATESCVWIFCVNDDPSYAAVGHAPSPHLTVEMARQVRDALDEFVRTAEAGD